MDHYGSNVTEVKPEDRRAYVPSDMLTLHTYTLFKEQFNANLPKLKAKIEDFNTKAAKVEQPQQKVPEAYPMETITMLSPKSFVITLPDYKRIHIPKGIIEVPIELSDHWYLEANGVEKYKSAPVEIPKEVSPSGDKKSGPPFKRGK